MTNMKPRQVLLLGALCPSLVQVTFAQTSNETASDTPAGKATPDVKTKDYIPVFISTAGALGSSVMYQSGGSIGVDTTTPAFTLDVNGTVNAASSFAIGGTAFAFGPRSMDNAFLGFAGNSTMTGTDNTAIGLGALVSNTTGDSSSAYAAEALYSNSTGGRNTAVGRSALAGNQGANAGPAVGYYALNVNNGQGNTAVGSQALLADSSGGNNIAIGDTAGDNITTTSNNIDIGNQGLVSDSGVIRIGIEITQNSTYIAGIYNDNVSGLQVLVNSSGPAAAWPSLRGATKKTSRTWRTPAAACCACGR